MIQGHGSDQYKYAGKVIADFSSNVWYQGAPKGLLQHLATCLTEIVHYPEPDGETLRHELANLHQLNSNQVILGNGSVELFYMLAQAFQGTRSTIVYPAFAEYEDACKTHQHQRSYLPINQLTANTPLQTDLLWLGNPNNPDGIITPPQVIQQLCHNHPNTIFVVDEAYAGLCHNFQSAIPLLAHCSNLIITRSLTKVFTMPGIRLGYALANTSLINQLRHYQIPWSVNTLALRAGSYLVQHYTDLSPDLIQMHQQSQQFQHALAQLPNIQLKNSPTNYCLLQLQHGTAQELKDYLIQQHGLLLRNASNFRGLTPSHFRVALQSPEHNQLLLQAINQFTQNKAHHHLLNSH